MDVCKFYFQGEIIEYEISSPFDESKIVCSVLYLESKKEIYIESANVLGLKIVPLFFLVFLQ